MFGGMAPRAGGRRSATIWPCGSRSRRDARGRRRPQLARCGRQLRRAMAVALAFAAAVAAVGGAYELLAAIERTSVTRLVAPLVRAGKEGVSPTVAERWRLAVLAAAA